MKFYWIAIIGILLILQCLLVVTVNVEPKCGPFKIDQLYDENPEPAFDEFPWIGLLFSNDSQNNRLKCVANLISERHAITAALCFDRRSLFKSLYVRFGDLNLDKKGTEQNCSDSNCAPMAQIFKVQDVAIHPNYITRQTIYDIAIIHLASDVTYSDYVKPICLPPTPLVDNVLVTNYYPIVGLILNLTNREVGAMYKTVGHVLPEAECKNTLIKISDRQWHASLICTSYVSDNNSLAGSAIMGVNVEDNVPLNYFLIGIVSYGTTQERIQKDFFVKISAHINWIQANIRQSFNNQTANDDKQHNKLDFKETDNYKQPNKLYFS